ncbi:MAG: acyltransferase [Anaerolineae bacterium]|nr:acyltransferase [Anaerolineae bacterium]
MSKRLLLLSGLAIIAVVCNHAIGWGFTAMFAWTNRYRPVAVPCFDQMGTLPYHILLSIQQLVVFSVPAFLFASGVFVAYAERASRASFGWKGVATRIKSLLVPYAIWSGVIFLSEALQGSTYTPFEYLRRFALGEATPAYYYVPLICQFYLSSPLLAPLAKTRAKLVLLVAALLQLGAVGVRYLLAYGAETPTLTLMIKMTPNWLFPLSAFFFVSGVVAGFHGVWFKQWLSQFRWGVLVAVVVLGLLAILEPQAPLQATRMEWARSLHTISSQLYAMAFILCFLAFDGIPIPSTRFVQQLGKNSYGIYLLHFTVLEVVARLIRQIIPWILAHQIIFQPLLVAMAIGVPLLFMTLVSRSPARRSYRYLFG